MAPAQSYYREIEICCAAAIGTNFREALLFKDHFALIFCDL
jgi:hypothetical protein